MIRWEMVRSNASKLHAASDVRLGLAAMVGGYLGQLLLPALLIAGRQLRRRLRLQSQV